MANAVSVGAAFCLVTVLLFVQAQAQVSMYMGPEMAPEMVPMMTPEMTPEMAPMMAPEAYSPTSPGPAVLDVKASSASSNAESGAVSGAAVLIGFATFFMY